jgi:hypothetical protein
MIESFLKERIDAGMKTAVAASGPLGSLALMHGEVYHQDGENSKNMRKYSIQR